MPDTPTPEQEANAKAAGWNPDDGIPPGGWDAHGEFVEPLAKSTNLDDLIDKDNTDAN